MLFSYFILFCILFYFILLLSMSCLESNAHPCKLGMVKCVISPYHNKLVAASGHEWEQEKKKKGFSFAEYLLRFLCGLWGRKAPDGKRDVKYLLRASRTPVGLLLHLVRVRNLKFIKLLCLWLEWSCLEFFVRDSAIFLLAKLISGKTCYHSFVFSKTLSFAQFVVS